MWDAVPVATAPRSAFSKNFQNLCNRSPMAIPGDVDENVDGPPAFRLNVV
jgi:hypothetical protein